MNTSRSNAKRIRYWTAPGLVILVMVTVLSNVAAQSTRQLPTWQQTSQIESSDLPQDNGRVVVNSDLVTLTVSVTDSGGRAVAGLDQSVFTVLDDKVSQRISFFADDDAPASIAVVFDTSGSMSEEKLARAKEALGRFIQTTDERDEYFLIDFDSRARLLLDRTHDSDAVLRKLTYVQPRGNTALYDAVYLGVETVMRGAHPKRAVILISDGEDNDSLYSLNELRRRLRESDAIIYAIGTVGSFHPNKGSLDGERNVGRAGVSVRRQSFLSTQHVCDERSI